jgi:gamma-glutamyltranspeptidase
LNLLENFTSPKLATEDAATAHAMIESRRLTPRNQIADPSLWPVDISAALSKDTARARWQCYFNPNRAVRPADLAQRGDSTGAGTRRCPAVSADGSSDNRETLNDSNEYCEPSPLDPACHASGTTSFAVADASGNMVVVTQTLGTWGGTFYVTPGLGFIYNDKMGSYGSDPDAYGTRLPFARVGSSISPTLVFRGTGADRKPLLAAGAAGNNWIGPAVYAIVTGVIDFHLGPQQALEFPRFIPSGGGGFGGGGAGAQAESNVDIESGFSPAVLRRLEEIGHRFNVVSLPGEVREGYAAAVLIENGKVRAGGDPRRSGAGGAVR